MKRKNIFMIILLVLFAILPYITTVGSGFVFDEYLLVLDNPIIQSFTHWKSFFTMPFWPGKTGGVYFRPITTLSYALNYALNKDSPFGYHLFNLVLHIACTLLVFFIVRKLFRELAFLSALIFAVHPVHCESISWIPGRTDLLSTLFIFSGWFFWLKLGEERNRLKNILFYMIVVIFFILAMLAKEIGIIFPALTLFSDFWKSRKRSLKEFYKRKVFLYFFLLTVLAVYFFIRSKVLSPFKTLSEPAYFSSYGFEERIMIMSRVFVEYLKLVFFPFPMRIDYYYARSFSIDNISLITKISSIIILILVFAFVFLAMKRQSIFGWLVLGIFISLLPFSHIISFPTLMALRFLYLPSFFSSIIISAFFLRLKEQYRYASLISFSFIILCYILMCFSRNVDFKDGFHFFRESIKEVPEQPEIHNMLGIFALKKGNLSLSEREFRTAILLKEDFSQAKMNLAVALIEQERDKEAQEILEELIIENPSLSSAHYNLGLLLYKQGKTEEATQFFKKAVYLEPMNFYARYQLARALEELGELEKAKKALDELLFVKPDFIPAIKLRLKLARIFKEDELFQKLEQRLKRLEK